MSAMRRTTLMNSRLFSKTTTLACTCDSSRRVTPAYSPTLSCHMSTQDMQALENSLEHISVVHHISQPGSAQAQPSLAQPSLA